MTLSSSTFSPPSFLSCFLSKWKCFIEVKCECWERDSQIGTWRDFYLSVLCRQNAPCLSIDFSFKISLQWAKRALKYQQIYHSVRYVTNRWCKISHIRQFEYLMWLHKMWSMIMEDRWNCESKWNRKWMSVISSFK